MGPQGLLWDSLLLQHLSQATPLSLTPCQVFSPAGGWEGALNVLGCVSSLICVLSEAARLLTGFLSSRLSWAQWCLRPAWGEVIHLDPPAGCAESASHDCPCPPVPSLFPWCHLQPLPCLDGLCSFSHSGCIIRPSSRLAAS